MNDIDNLTYEQAREELIQIVNTLENQILDLQTSMDMTKRAEQLVAKCNSYLDEFKAQLGGNEQEDYDDDALL